MKRFIILLFTTIVTLYGIAQNSILENDSYCLKFDSNDGSYSIIDKRNNEICIKKAYFQFNQWKSTDSIFHCKTIRPQKNKLRIICSAQNIPQLTVDITLEKENFFSFQYKITNNTNRFFRLLYLSPLKEGYIYPKHKKDNMVNILDGFGGGEPNQINKQIPVYSRNNLMIYWEENNIPYNIVAGGMTYKDFEKFVSIESTQNRKQVLSKVHKIKSYLNLGFDQQNGFKEMLRLGTGEPCRFNELNDFLHTAVYGWNFILVDALHLCPEKQYYCGMTFCDNGYTSKQAIFADNGKPLVPKNFTDFKPLNEQSSIKCLVPQIHIPNITKGERPLQVLFPIPKDLYSEGNCRLLIKHLEGQKAIASEIFLCEGKLDSTQTIPYPITEYDFQKMILNLYAYDEIGKGIHINETYSSEDKFYLDLSDRHPFHALEKYAAIVKKEQNISLSYYPYPTICMWYAHEKQYGNSYLDGTSSACINEIKNVRTTNFLDYSPIGIRLVPVSLGWQDDVHTLYGTYSKPYETTKKWAKTLSQLGGVPFYYFTNVRIPHEHNEYADTYPKHMLFNCSKAYVPCYDFMQNACSGYDYTDPGFIRHLKTYSYPRLRKAGVKGGMWDFPYTTWPKFGGMEDSCSTAAAAYVNIYKTAQQGMGKDALLQERNLDRGSDVTLGYISSQRTEGDTDLFTPDMATKIGLRWYKNRMLFNYDADAKNLLKTSPNNKDGRRKLLTMSYVAGSRLLLANSFSQLNKEIIYDLTRIVPFHQTPISARPIDMFINKHPKIYDMKINNEWHQLTLYNIYDHKNDTIKIDLAAQNHKGGLELDSCSYYHIYEFWDNNYLGKFKGNEILMQILRPGEAKMLSIHKTSSYPQIISSDRHILQGFIDLSKIKWKTNILSGKIKLIKSQPTIITIALNNWDIENKNELTIKQLTSNIAQILFKSNKTESRTFKIKFRKR